MRPDSHARRERGIRRALRPVLAGLLAATLLPAIPAGAHESTFAFDGGGWGHSVGLSQYGALGMSQEGATFEEILTHYFTGTSVADVDPDLAAEPVWVNLTTENPTLTLTVRAIGPDPVPATVTVGAHEVVAGVGEKVTVTRLSHGGCRVTGPTETASGDCFVSIEWDGWEESPSTAIEIGGCFLVNWNAPGGSVSQPCTYARGTMHVRPDNNTNTVNVSLEIDVEDYVLGISEMPYGWATIGGAAALQAQAVAARSYVFARARWRGEPETRPWCWCQVYDTHYDQTYVGWGHGTQDWLDAVVATEGLILTHPSVTRDGALVPVETFYSSSTFGRTENSEDAFNSAVPYLRSVDDHWSQLPSVGNPHASWTRHYTDAELARLLPGLSSVTGAEITECSETGAALEVTFHGTGGPIAFRTSTLRGTLSLRSQQIVSITGPTGVSSCDLPGFAGAAPTTTTTTTVPPTTTTTMATTRITVPATTTTTTMPPTTTTTTTAPPVTTTTTIPPTTTTTTAPPTTTTIPTTVPPSTGTDTCEPDELSIDALLGSQRLLRHGTVGDDVRDVQQLLSALAMYEGPIDGIYGTRTAAAVRAFQDARGLSVDGVVGSRTRGELAGLLGAAEHRRVLTADGSLLRRGVTGDVVRALQVVLGTLGYDPGPVDGIFGSRTAQAVRLFQQDENLLVDGVVGIQSRAALTAALDLHEYADCG
jgi:SpoIID/LytB domain protein